MARQGIAITQEGIDVSQALDYQKVLDSRWLFLEVGMDIDETVEVPSLGTPSSRGVQRINIAKHNMARGGRNYVPAMHASWNRTPAPVDFDDESSYDFNTGIAVDSEYVYFYREYFSGITLPGYSLQVRARVYTLPILQEYLAPVEVAPASFKQNTNIGVRALDGSDSSVRINSKSAHGFSIDTRKKILSVNKVVQKYITEVDDFIEHGSAYPPSYLFCNIIDNLGGSGQAVKPLYHQSTHPLVLVDDTKLYFRGMQSVFRGNLAVIIIKDPIEVAR